MTFDRYLDREELLGLMAPVLARHRPEAFAVLLNGRQVEHIAEDFRQKLRGDHAVYRSIYRRLQEKFSQPTSTLGEGSPRQLVLKPA
jgi:hypothetical protein